MCWMEDATKCNPGVAVATNSQSSVNFSVCVGSQHDPYLPCAVLRNEHDCDTAVKILIEIRM